jgi:hypothetical protein
MLSISAHSYESRRLRIGPASRTLCSIEVASTSARQRYIPVRLTVRRNTEYCAWRKMRANLKTFILSKTKKHATMAIHFSVTRHSPRAAVSYREMYDELPVGAGASSWHASTACRKL